MSATKLRALVLYDGIAGDGSEEERADARPRVDVRALQHRLGADLLDYAAARSRAPDLFARTIHRASPACALALLAYSRRQEYDVIVSSSERVSIPLGMLLLRARARPAHVMIGHRLTAPKKRVLLQGIRSTLDHVFVYATPQAAYARDVLGLEPRRVERIAYQADERFFRPIPPTPESRNATIASAGLEWRDYATLVEAARGLPATLRLTAYSPLSRRKNRIGDVALPPNVDVRRYDFRSLRQLYADSRFIVVPLDDADFAAGITAILEAMAMGKAVITTRVSGQSDTVRDGVTGLYVPLRDVRGWRAAMDRLLGDPREAERMGEAGRQALVASMTLDAWTSRIAEKAREAASLARDDRARHGRENPEAIARLA